MALRRLLGIGLGLVTGTAVHGQTLSGHAVAVWHWTDPSAESPREHRFQVLHPMATLRLGLGRYAGLRITGNGEGLTIPAGELALGNWGEGFIDRRHPHSYLHEAIADAGIPLGCGGRCRAGGFLGKGFVAFGSDDPMTRPALRYPINHHFSQILERAVVGLQAEVGRALLEATLFNGDEPEHPGQWPRIGGRFGDSWAARLVVAPADGLEASLSHASVRSPEHRPGAGATQAKWHGSVSWHRTGSSAFLEWARTSELDGFFVFETALLEASRSVGALRIAARLERTTRPEEERQSPTRSSRPHLENSILGTTRWSVATLTASRRPARGRWSWSPLLELSYGRIESRSGIFDPSVAYGGSSFVAASVGVRWLFGESHERVGRYGLRRDGQDRSAGHPSH
ncbi:MAG: hypothetical protein FJ206_17185 [Gemmatimonadetes bacterium]|nr:hypothetical protein [Gemmatimonadota bacterium]